jgi:hypothetical protein
MCRCQFRNRQQKIVSLLIQKSAAKNFVVADSEINRKTAAFSV